MSHVCQGKEKLRLRREGVIAGGWRRNFMDEEQMRRQRGKQFERKKKKQDPAKR